MLLGMRAVSQKIWHGALEAVLPKNVIHNKHLKLNGSVLQVDDRSYVIDNNVFVVGVGKAAAGMYQPVQEMFGSHIRQGILSVPFGSKKFITYPVNKNTYVYEGARDNLPDEASFTTAKQIVKLCQMLFARDILIVLVSGGGSALCPYPVPPITLKEKRELLKKLVLAGAKKSEVQQVRRCISVLKGGGLVVIAHPAKVIGLILSNVIGDSIEDVAGGLTSLVDYEYSQGNVAGEIISRYNLRKDCPKSVYKVLSELSLKYIPEAEVRNVLIGTNGTAVRRGRDIARELGYESFIIGRGIRGEAGEVGPQYVELIRLILADFVTQLRASSSHDGLPFGVSPGTLLEMGSAFRKTSKICLLSGGITDFSTSKQKAVGGRNQKLVLAFALAAQPEVEDKRGLFRAIDFLFMSCATDGIDGDTDAAGAITYNGQLTAARQKGLDPVLMMQKNDFYSFFKAMDDLVVTGITGTNVMDVQIILIQKAKN